MFKYCVLEQAADDKDNAKLHKFVDEASQLAFLQGKEADDRIYPLRLFWDDVVLGIPFDWGLVSSQGAGFMLFPELGTPRSTIAQAKATLRSKRDVVYIQVQPCMHVIHKKEESCAIHT